MPEAKDMENMRSHGQKVEPAMLILMAWLIRSRYRTILHRHNGTYKAIDEISGDEWTADSVVGLAEIMTSVMLK